MVPVSWICNIPMFGRLDILRLLRCDHAGMSLIGIHLKDTIFLPFVDFTHRKSNSGSPDKFAYMTINAIARYRLICRLLSSCSKKIVRGFWWPMFMVLNMPWFVWEKSSSCSKINFCPSVVDLISWYLLFGQLTWCFYNCFFQRSSSCNKIWNIFLTTWVRFMVNIFFLERSSSCSKKYVWFFLSRLIFMIQVSLYNKKRRVRAVNQNLKNQKNWVRVAKQKYKKNAYCWHKVFGTYYLVILSFG